MFYLITNYIFIIQKPKEWSDLIQKYREGQEDMDKQGELSAIMNGARSDSVNTTRSGIKRGTSGGKPVICETV